MDFYQMHETRPSMHYLDEEVESPVPFNPPPAVLERAQATLAHMAATKNAPRTPDEEPPELSERQQECVEAFAVREEVKNLRG